MEGGGLHLPPCREKRVGVAMKKLDVAFSAKKSFSIRAMYMADWRFSPYCF
jgi:hypothetical protein